MEPWQDTTAFKKLPGKLRDYESFTQLRKEIEDFQTILPLLAELSKDSIKARHWDEVMKICNTTFEVVGNPEFKLQSLLEADLVSVSEEIEEVTDGADNQLKIEHQLGEIKGQWRTKEFLFAEWKDPWRAHFQGNTNGHQGSVRNGDGGSTNKNHFRLLLSFPSFSYLFEDKDKKWHLYDLQSKQGKCCVHKDLYLDFLHL